MRIQHNIMAMNAYRNQRGGSAAVSENKGSQPHSFGL